VVAQNHVLVIIIHRKNKKLAGDVDVQSPAPAIHIQVNMMTATKNLTMDQQGINK